MHPQLTTIRNELHAASAQAEQLCANLRPSILGRRPDENTWSVAECIQHLTITTDAYLALINPALEEARRQQSTTTAATTPYTTDLMSRLLAWWLEPPYRLKSKTPAAFIPHAADPAQVLPNFLTRQERLQAAITNADGLDLNLIRIASPFAPSMKYNLYAAFCLIAVHQRRHLWQAGQISGRHLEQ